MLVIQARPNETAADSGLTIMEKLSIELKKSEK